MIELSEKKFERVLEVRGHLIDSMILTRIFDKIMDLKGDFNVLEFKIGKRKNELSYARLMVHGKNKKHLDQLLATLYIEGAQPVVIEEVLIKPAPEDMVMPSDFYSTNE